MIKISNACKNYELGGKMIKAVDEVSLEIQKGEFVAIVGPSGSGKSTLLHIIGGLDKPNSGSVYFENINLSNLKDRELAKYRSENIGFVFQTFNLQAILTAEENAALPLLFARVKPKARKKIAEEALEKVGLEKRANHKPGELSGGERQRVAIARALINNPKVLIADEPTGNLDSKTGEAIMELFKDLNKKHGLTVIIVTHNLDDAEYAERKIRMRDGKIIN